MGGTLTFLGVGVLALLQAAAVVLAEPPNSTSLHKANKVSQDQQPNSTCRDDFAREELRKIQERLESLEQKLVLLTTGNRTALLQLQSSTQLEILIKICYFAASEPPGKTDAQEEVIIGLSSGGVKAYSKHTDQVRTVKGGKTEVSGIAYDFKLKKIYYATQTEIHWVNLDGTGDERLFSSEECELIGKHFPIFHTKFSTHNFLQTAKSKGSL